MPDMCFSHLKVSGPDLAKFVEAVRRGDNPISLTALLPEPAGLSASEVHDGRRANWGVKWEAEPARFTADSETVVYSFQTPWGPPITWLDSAAGHFPGLRLVLSCEIDYFNYSVAAWEDGRRRDLTSEEFAWATAWWEPGESGEPAAAEPREYD